MANELVKITQLQITEKRFWANVIKGPDCWVWQGSKNIKGYGRINIKGNVWLAHRVSYLLHFGFIDTSLCVLHKCDNPACCNPSHLFLGTIKDNNDDMRAKGRACDQTGTIKVSKGLRHGRYTKPECSARGERNGSSKVSDYAIEMIRTFHNTNALSQTLLSKAFDLHISTINRIINHKTRNNVNR